MELSEAFRFFTILSESFKLIYKVLKPISALTAISTTIFSIIILLLSYIIRSLGDDLLDFTFLLALFIFTSIYILLSMFIRVSTILVSATYRTGSIISLREVPPVFKSIYKTQIINTNFANYHIVPIIIVMLTVVAVSVSIPYVNMIAISILVGVSAFIYYLNVSVVSVMTMVVSVIEPDCSKKKPVERAKELVQGQRVHGFLLMLFLHFVVPLGFGDGYWLSVGDKVVANLTVFILVTVNLSSLLQIILLVAYTVFYFDCKQRRGEEIELVRSSVQYSELPTVATEELNDQLMV